MDDDRLQRSRGANAVLVSTLLYLLVSVLSWQRDCIAGICHGREEWGGIGVIAGLLAVALLAWELNRMARWLAAPGSLDPSLISVALSLALLLTTVRTYQDHQVARTWAPWASVIVSIVIVVAALAGAFEERAERSRVRSELSGR